MAKQSFDYGRLTSHPRFKALARKIGGEFANARALDCICRFWDVALPKWGDGRQLLPLDDFEIDEEFTFLVDAKFAEVRPDGVYARGAKDNFEWLVELRDHEAQSKAGKASAASRVEKYGSAQPFKPSNETPNENSNDPRTDSNGPERSPNGHSNVPNPSISISSSSSKRTHKHTRTRTLIWEPTDPLSKIFQHLIAIEAYAKIFDREHERETVQRHMDTHGLAVSEMERIALELRNYCDGLSEPIKSPRGKLSTFVQRYAERRPKSDPNRLNVKTLEDLEREANL